MSDSESQPLLRSRSGQAGVINDTDQTEAESNPASITTQTSSTNQGSCVSCCNRLRSEPDQCRLLVINLLVLVFACLTAGLMLVELSMAYGQCIIGMPLYEGGLLTQNVEKFWCRCPLYTVMLTSTVAWISIMINWVSDLRTKKCAFAKWTKWQFILTLGGSIFTFCAFIVSIWGFGKWCERVKHSDDGGDNVYVSSSSKSSQMCFDAAVSFDNRFTNHDEQFVKLVHTFWYSIGITILEGLLTIWWFGANWLSFRLWSKGSRELFYANYDILTRNDANDRSLRRGRNTNEATTNEADNGNNDGDNESNAEPIHSN